MAITDEDRNYRRHSTPEREALWDMMETYWGQGDGSSPPRMIERAADLCAYPLPPVVAPKTDAGLCAGGVAIGLRACPKCGATEDDNCLYATSK